MQHIKQVLQALQDRNLQVMLEKSTFCIYEVKYLRYIILDKEVKINPKKIHVIKK